ncbi:GNAT family N-acetyltransferase [Streptococcus timonensis]
MKSIGTKTLHTERLLLRRFCETDAQAMFENWASSLDNLTYVTWDPHPNVDFTKNSIRTWVASYDNPNYYKWAISLKENPEYVIGDISLVSVDEENSSCEVGYILGMDYWGRGLMTEALKAVLSYCLDEIGFEEVDACYASLNPASGRVMEKAGMTFWKTIPNAVERKGYIADKIYYQIKKAVRQKSVDEVTIS